MESVGRARSPARRFLHFHAVDVDAVASHLARDRDLVAGVCRDLVLVLDLKDFAIGRHEYGLRAVTLHALRGASRVAQRIWTLVSDDRRHK